MPDHASLYRGHRFPPEVIAHAVRLYLRFALSYRDVEELLEERGIVVSYETVRHWVAKFGAQYADALRKRETPAGRTWHLDEMALRAGGRLQWLWRAVDEHGTTLDVLLQEHRDTAAAERFFSRLLAVAGSVPPERITTDNTRDLPAGRPAARLIARKLTEPATGSARRDCRRRRSSPDWRPRRRRSRSSCPSSASRPGP